MSNIIPFVSSSPPPIDEDQSFGWNDDDDEDDDFGNFASAPGFGSPSRADDNLGDEGFDADWSVSGANGDRESSPVKHDQNIENKSVPTNSENSSARDGSLPKSNLEHDKEEVRQDKEQVDSDVVADDDDFADFAAFQDTSSSKAKPHIDSLPLKTTHQPKLDGDPESDTGVGKGAETVMEKSRESTTDSGLFSTDLSPLPQSESVCTSEGDKTMQSDDEFFTDIPQDNQSESVIDHVRIQPDHGQEEPSESEHSEVVSAKKPDEQSDGMSSSNQLDQSKEAEIPDSSLTQNHELCNSASPALSSEEVEYHNQQELPGISDIKNSTLEKNDRSEDGSESAIEQTPHSTIDPPATAAPIGETENSISKLSGASDEDEHDGANWATFKTSTCSSFIAKSEKDTIPHQDGEPEDLVLRKDSINFDDEEDVSVASSDDASTANSEKGKSAKDTEEGVGEERSIDCASTPFKKDGNDGQSPPEVSGDLTDNGSVDTSSLHTDQSQSSDLHTDAKEELGETSAPASSYESSHILSAHGEQNCAASRDDDSWTEDDDFGDFSGQTHPIQTIPHSENGTTGSEDSEDFAKFSSTDMPVEKHEESDFGSFSSKQAVAGEEDDDDDFGDFNSGYLSSGAPATKTDTDDFGAFSEKSADTGGNDDDDFGDFNGQPGASSDSGWADFNEPAKPATPEATKATASDGEDFGSFSGTDQTTAPASISDTSAATVHESLPTSGSSSASQDIKEKKLEIAFKSCFPVSTGSEQTASEGNDTEENVDVMSCEKNKLGMLETILEYGLQYRSASQQTWQVVQHPSKKDPRVKLWGHLQDVDGSPAVIYQWGKSCTNSHLFHTLHIDTQNMLIGHKKRSVPIFATGLSLLEPIRGGRKEREAGGGGQLNQNSISNMLTPTLVDPNQQEVERPTQEIPAVDFDWSTSGLTNPLTSHSLDLDFLVAQDSQASDKPSVFESELLDAPRSSVKSSQPLEDILKSVKPTSVRSRRDDAATSQMSAEALRILSGLPDLTFMQSKVLMFPIKN